jgi:hypothetical protein
VPEDIITSTNNAKYDVMAGARLNFIENRVIPLCRRLEAEESVTVKAIDPEADGWFDVEDHPVLAQARRARLAAARAGFDMGIPFNDLNRAFDLGFRPLPWGDKGYIPGGMQPADAGPAPAGNPKAEDRKPTSKPDGQEDTAEDNDGGQKSRPNVFTRLAAALTTNNNHR